ncbi:MAG: FAD:protein FMN transferase [Psychrobacter sp.]|nr:FAD:protein FMN transferase [Psychrobacter sp.]
MRTEAANKEAFNKPTLNKQISNKQTSNENTPQLVTFNIRAMGCQVRINLNISSLSYPLSKVELDQQTCLLASKIEQKLAYWEHIFSRFNETSELMQLNHHTNQWWQVSAELFEVLQLAIEFVPKTQGLVTPTLLQSMWAAGYKHSFETLPKLSIPTKPCTDSSAMPCTALNIKENAEDRALGNDRHQNIESIQLHRLTDGTYQVYLPTGMALDLNGYVKGWCAMQLADYISRGYDYRLPCLVDMGGDIAIGVPDNQDAEIEIDPVTWGIAIAKPYAINSEPPFFDEACDVSGDEDVAVVSISSGAIATSGQDYRRWRHKGRWQHHLIHPHHSCPVTSDVLTATVIAADTMTAEVYAKYCVLLGSKAAMAWLNNQNIAALLIDTEYNVMVSPAMRPSLIQLL